MLSIVLVPRHGRHPDRLPRAQRPEFKRAWHPSLSPTALAHFNPARPPRPPLPKCSPWWEKSTTLSTKKVWRWPRWVVGVVVVVVVVAAAAAAAAAAVVVVVVVVSGVVVVVVVVFVVVPLSARVWVRAQHNQT